MKKFLLRVLFFAVYALFLQVVLPVYVDPFNVFHENIGINGNTNYNKMRYILNHPDRFDSFMFGSSRVGVIHTENIPDSKTYNMTYTMGTPSEHLANIKTFIANNIRPSKIYVGLDDFSYMEDPDVHILQPLRCPYEYLRDHPKHLYSLYLKPMDALLSLKNIFSRYRNSNNVGNDRTFHNYGTWADYGNKKRFIRSNSDSLHPGSIREFDMARTFKAVQEIVNVCRENDIELILFTNPIHCLTYMRAYKRNYIDFLTGLADISEFYNFSGLNDITLNDENYLDDSHYTPETGDLILNVICSNEIYPELYAQGFGVKVTKDNAEEFIAMLKSQAEKYAIEQ